MKKIPRERLLYRLRHKGISILTETRVIAFQADKALLKSIKGEERWIKTDDITTSIGSTSENNLALELEGKIYVVLVVGDAVSPGNLGSALRSATEAVIYLWGGLMWPS